MNTKLDLSVKTVSLQISDRLRRENDVQLAQAWQDDDDSRRKVHPKIRRNISVHKTSHFHPSLFAAH